MRVTRAVIYPGCYSVRTAAAVTNAEAFSIGRDKSAGEELFRIVKPDRPARPAVLRRNVNPQSVAVRLRRVITIYLYCLLSTSLRLACPMNGEQKRSSGRRHLLACRSRDRRAEPVRGANADACARARDAFATRRATLLRRRFLLLLLLFLRSVLSEIPRAPSRSPRLSLRRASLRSPVMRIARVSRVGGMEQRINNNNNNPRNVIRTLSRE